MTNNFLVNFLAVLLLITKVITNAESTVVTCDGVIVNGSYFEKEVLVTDVERPYSLMMHNNSDQLFFSHTIWDHNEVDFAIQIYEMKTNFTRDIKGIPGGYAIAYDQAHDGIYFGGHDGIYKYNPPQNTITFHAEKDKSIWGLFIRNDFYYIEYPSQKLYVYKKGKFVRDSIIDIDINNIFVSNNSEIFFSNDTTLLKIEKTNSTPSILRHNITIKQIAEDSRGNIYFCASDGIYVEDKRNNTVMKLADLDNAFGMTFDGKDQIIFSNMHSIYRLLPSKYGKICIKAIDNAKKEETKKRRSLLHNVMSLL